MRRLAIAILLVAAAISFLAVDARRRSWVNRDAGDGAIAEGADVRLEPIPGALEGDEEVSTPRQPVDAAAAPLAGSSPHAPASRGRVLDARTGEPVGRLVIRVGDTEIPVDASGTFAFGAPLIEDGRPLIVFDAFRRSHVETLDRDEVRTVGAESIVRVAIGPTYYLRLVGFRLESSDRLLARLVEHRVDGREEAGIWLQIPGPPEPCLRLEKPWPVHDENSTYEVQVHSENGVLSGASAPLDRAVGVYPEIVAIELERAFGILHGRVVDPEGRPQPRARLVAVPLSSSMPTTSPETWPDATANADGVFRFAPLPAGTYEVVARPSGSGRSARVRDVLEPGEHELGDLVVEPRVSAGSIRGRLQVPAGSRFLTSDRVRLRSVDGRSPDRFAHPEFPNVPRSKRSHGPTSAPFAFASVPAGEFELTIVSPFGTTWTPERALVTAPASDVVFLREEIGRENVCIDVEDAATGAPIGAYSYSVRVGRSPLPIAEEGIEGTFCLGLPVNAELEWRVWAEGYRSVRIGRGDFTASPEGLRAKASLGRGFDATIRVLDFGDGIEPDDWAGRFAAISHAGVAGAEISADGVVLARTGADGTATIDADREPAGIEVVAPGWRAAACWNLAEGRILAARQDVLVWMVRE